MNRTLRNTEYWRRAEAACQQNNMQLERLDMVEGGQQYLAVSRLSAGIRYHVNTTSAEPIETMAVKLSKMLDKRTRRCT